MYWKGSVRILRTLSYIWTIILGAVVLVSVLALAVRLVIPFAPWLEAPVVSMVPPAGAVDVIPRSTMTLTFSQPMNRHAVEKALRIEPATEGNLVWNADNRELQFIPSARLLTGVTYTVRLEASAASRWWHPLATPLHVTFRTARSPTVVSALPNTNDVTSDTEVALVFSHPMVPDDALDVPIDVPGLQIEPPIRGVARWIRNDTLVLHASASLQADTSYQATIANLSDVRGIEMEQPYTWNWTTAGPTVLAVTPEHGERWVAPRQPLTLTLGQPLDVDTLPERLVITPTMTGAITTAMLPDSTQVITFTPIRDWTPGQTYSVTFKLVLQPTVTSNLDAPGTDNNTVILPRPERQPAEETWSFTAAPLPALVSQFPAENQVLPRGQAVRLIFHTPMDSDALRSGLTFDPPVENVRVNVSAMQVNITAAFQPSTPYTLTIPADIVDRNGVALGVESRLRFLTAPIEPGLDLPEVIDSILSVPTTRPIDVSVTRTNISALDLALYRLDEATLVRTINFSATDWRDFTPERYNQQHLRTWRVALNDAPDRSVTSTIPVVIDDGQPLAPGAYYLHIRTPEGPRTDVVLLVSDIDLILKQSTTQVLVWATSATTGLPLTHIPLTLFQGDAVVAEGVSDANGVWQVALPSTIHDLPYLVLAGGAEPAVVSSAWQLPTDLNIIGTGEDGHYQMVLVTDRQSYAPGETLLLGGFVRRALPDGTLALLSSGTYLDVALQEADSSTVLARTQVLLPASGIISSTLHLDTSVPSGAYVVHARVGDQSTQTPVWINPGPTPLHVVFAPVDEPATLSTGGLSLRVLSAGVPVAKANVAWKTRALPAEPVLDTPLPAGFHLGDPDTVPMPLLQEGRDQTNLAGQLTLPLIDPALLTETLRYEITARIEEPGGLRTEVSTLHTMRPAGNQTALRLPSRVVGNRERAVVQTLSINPDGTPVAGVRTVIELYRRSRSDRPGGSAEPTDVLIATQQITADEQGRGQLEFIIPDGGEYRIVAHTGTTRSAATLWVTAPGYTNWFEQNGGLTLIPDRDSYQPGDMARLLVMLPASAASALVTLEQHGVLSAEVTTLRAGNLLEIPVTPEMAPNVYVGVLASYPAQSGQARSNQGAKRIRSGYARLNVVSPLPVLTTTVTTDQTTYVPGATMTLTITTQDDQGRGVSSQLLLAVSEQGWSSSAGPDREAELSTQFTTHQPAGFITASGMLFRDSRVWYGQSRSTGRAPSAVPHRYSEPVRVAYWNTTLRTADNGTLVLRVPLPAESVEWQIDVYAVRGADTFGQAHTQVTARTPLELQAQVPPGFRAGDRTEVALMVRNTLPLTQEVQVTVLPAGVMLDHNTSATQIQTLLPGRQHLFVWPIVALSDDDVVTVEPTLRFHATAIGQGHTRATYLVRTAIPLGPSGPVTTRRGTWEVTRPVTQTIALALRESGDAAGSDSPDQQAIDCQTSSAFCPWAALELAVAPSVRHAVVRSALDLAALPQRTVEQEASLLFLCIALARSADTAEMPLWQDRIRTSLEWLNTVQNDDGGWGLEPERDTSAVITAYVLEAQAAASAVLDLDFEPDPQALRVLRQAYHMHADPDFRAYLQYVLTLADAGHLAAMRGLLDADLRADSLAYLSLALPPDEASVALTRLMALAQRDTTPGDTGQASGVRLYWRPETGVESGQSIVSTTALAVQALQRLQPTSTQLTPALRTLRLAWDVDGWPTTLDSARVAGALLADHSPPARTTSRSTTSSRTFQVRFNDQPLLRSNVPVSTTLKFLLTGHQLRVHNDVRMKPPSAQVSTTPMLVAYRLYEQTSTDRQRTDTLVVTQQYLDPVRGDVLHGAELRPGQLLQVRLTLLVLQPASQVQVESPLPSAFVLLDTAHQKHVDWTVRMDSSANRAVIFESQTLDPGVYTHTYLVRVVAAGTFSVPPPRATLSITDGDAALGRTERITVTQSLGDQG